MSKESPPFPREQFIDVFQVTSKIKNKLQPFIAEYKKQNMNWIIASMQQIHRFVYEPNSQINFKFNSVFVIKFMLDTAEIVLVNLIQIYFLPKLSEVAGYDLKSTQDKRGTGYFASVGYLASTPDIQKLSYNFVRVSTEIVQAAAKIKPRALYYADQLITKSDYLLTALRLKENGWKPYEKPAYYKQGSIQAITAQYKQNLEAFDDIADSYIDFYVGIFKVILQRGKHYDGRLNPRKILEVGDSYITSPVIQICADNIKSSSLKNRLQALHLLNDFVRWGDIQAASQINCTALLDQTLREIAVLEGGNSGINRGKSLFAKLESNQQAKQQFYVEFLKSVQFWALCFPKGIKDKNRQSKIKLAHDELRMKLKIEFPDDKSLKQNRQQFEKNMKRKQQRNGIILSQLEHGDPQYVSIIPSPKKNESKAPIQSEKSIPSIKEIPKPPAAKESSQPPESDYYKIKRRFQQANNCLKTLGQSQPLGHQKVKAILKLKSQYEDLVYSADVTDDQLNQLIVQGEVLNSQIEGIQNHLESYNSNKLSFKDFVEAINPKKSPSKIKPEEKSLSSKNDFPPASIPSKPVIRSVQNVKSSQKNSLNIDPAKYNIDEASISKKLPDYEATPIKKMQQQLNRQRASEDHSLASLPQISKQSLQKSLDQQHIGSKSKLRQQQFQIQPQSHKNQRISQNLFNQQQKKIESIKKMENQFREYRKSTQKQIERQNPIDKLLEEEFQREIEINKPKNLNNVKGSYKLKSQLQVSSIGNSRPVVLNKDKQVNIHDSRHSSRQGSRVDFQQSRVQKKDNPIEDDDDLICMPEINPLELSFHDIGGFQQQIKDNKQLSFKKCFQADKYLLGVNKTAKMFWLEKDTLNLIKSGSQRKQSRHKQNSISIPEILSEKDRKYQQDMKYIQQQKNRKIKDLEKKVANLKQQGQKMTIKLVQQQKQLQTFKLDSSMASSINKKNFYQTDQDNLAYMQHKNMKQKSLYDYSVKQKRYPQTKFLEPQGRLISSLKYTDYFSNFNDEKKKKNLLRNKQLLLKDENIQFGCMSKKEKDQLVITFYITPQIQLEGLRCNLVPAAHPSLDIRVEPRVIPSIRKKKQEKIILIVKVREIPYTFPEIQFTYSLDGKMESHKFTVPCSFHKFVQIEQISYDHLIKQLQRSKNVIRGEEVPYSKKLLKNMDVLCEFFPNGELFRKGAPNNDGQVQFGGLASWGRQKFLLKISIKPSQFLFVQAVSEIKSETSEYYICLLTNLLMKNLQEGSRIDP